MLAALFIPNNADDDTVEAVAQTGAKYGMVICVQKNFSAERKFTCTLFPPGRIPAGDRELAVRVKTPYRATVGLPCVA